ncbi:hypothetical protein HDF13_002055 [Edaphobacter lichenicola]|uniref:Uncharacterized protein n=1 Tax=Tunturiibacter gelidiferens TaxID=3069689 RepID=A0ACC5NYP7_9BACT|nr:hypothetical protein [Edaphobacter lichenicola]
MTSKRATATTNAKATANAGFLHYADHDKTVVHYGRNDGFIEWGDEKQIPAG